MEPQIAQISQIVKKKKSIRRLSRVGRFLEEGNRILKDAKEFRNRVFKNKPGFAALKKSA